MDNTFFESSFEIPFKISHALKTKTTPCKAPPGFSSGMPMDLKEVLRRFRMFHDRCIEAVKAQKRQAAGPFADMLPQHADDFDAVFRGVPYIASGVVAGIAVEFVNHRTAATRSLPAEVFTILRVGEDRFLTVLGS